MKERRRRTWAWLALAALTPGAAAMAQTRGAEKARECEKVVLTGEVSAGQQWQAEIGEGWVFRVLPIRAGKTGADAPSGWDLVVDRVRAAGYPDALLLATPPYKSIGEREVGTTYGLRAQDAIGWNPRSFRFMTDPSAFREAQRLYLSLSRAGWGQPAGAHGRSGFGGGNAAESTAVQELMKFSSESSAGTFRILDAHITPGTGDAAPYAENWALQSRFVPQTDVPAPDGKSTARGEIEWLKFSVTLWLPQGWKVPRKIDVVRSGCE